MDKKRELVVYGAKAVRALLARHPERVRRLFFDKAHAAELKEVTSRLARERRVYRLLDGEELEAVAESTHHGGMAAVIDRPTWGSPAPEYMAELASSRRAVLLLDGVANAHNLGALVRSAAFFGVRCVFMERSRGQTSPSPSVWRVAEGGMELVDVFAVPDLVELIRRLGRSHFVLGTSVNASQTLEELRGSLDAERRGIALVLGNEESGLSRPVGRACHAVARLPGATNAGPAAVVSSLNVASAAAVFMYELWGE